MAAWHCTCRTEEPLQGPYGPQSVKVNPDFPFDGIYNHHGNNTLSMSMRDFIDWGNRWEKIHSTCSWHHVMSWCPGLNQKERASWVATFPLHSDCRCSVTSHLMLLLPRLPHHVTSLWARVNPSYLQLLLTAVWPQQQKEQWAQSQVILTRSHTKICPLILWSKPCFIYSYVLLFVKLFF